MNDRSEADGYRAFGGRPVLGWISTVAVFIVWIIGMSAIPTVAGRFFGAVPEESLGFAIAEFVFTAAIGLAFWKLARVTDPLKALGLRPDRRAGRDWIWGMLFGFGGVAVAVAVLAAGGAVRLEAGAARGPEPAAGPYGWIVSILMFAFYAGGEELIERGILFRSIRGLAGLVWAIVLSSITFSLLHLLNPFFSIPSAVDIFLAGVFLALLRELTGNLYLAWGAHFGWNFALASIGLRVSGFLFRMSPQSWHIAVSGPGWLTGGAFGPEGGMSGIIANLAMVVVAGWLVWRRRRRKPNSVPATEITGN